VVAPDAAELAELLQFLSGCLARDSGRLGVPWKSLTATLPATSGQLRDDLERFTFLHGGSDGEPLFGPGSPRPTMPTPGRC
jgi:hypothetical protein